MRVPYMHSVPIPMVAICVSVNQVTEEMERAVQVRL